MPAPNRNILLVSADSPHARTLGANLQQFGYSLRHCTALEQARLQTAARRPDVILLDVDAFGDTAWKFCREVASATPAGLLILTEKDETETRVQALRAGADSLVAVPVSIRLVFAEIEALRRRTARATLQPPAEPAAPESPADFAGSLSAFPLIDLIQLLHTCRKSGRLKISNGESSGEIVFDQGELVFALNAGSEGEAAAYELAGHEEGTFEFVERPPGRVDRNIRLSTMKVVLECCTRHEDLAEVAGVLGDNPAAMVAQLG